MLAQQIRGALDAPGPAQAEIGAADRGVSGNQFKAAASLVDAEQRAAQRDLADQTLSVRRGGLSRGLPVAVSRTIRLWRSPRD